ncbi:class I SAM-dependent methyltransferase [Marinobacter sp.]|uniref:class I SAM-dependent methyltransferase n=1 Tax=Marinobacter sp. TaxID=50741 RepID=UPI002B270D9E|nr:class I SAM-dependent methyltransferase [Marinobacter sp.]
MTAPIEDVLVSNGSMKCPVCELAELGSFREIEQKRYLRCGNCKATVMAPECRLPPEEERAVYHLHDNDPNDAGYRRFLSKLADPLMARLPQGAGGLDFGCGPGPALARMFEEAGFSVALYDLFFYPEASVLEQSYDFVTCTEVVEHLFQPAKVFAQFDRLLNPGGVLGIMTCFQTDDDRFDNWHYRRDPTHVVFYREATFQWLAKRYGWQMDSPAKDVVLLRKPL